MKGILYSLLIGVTLSASSSAAAWAQGACSAVPIPVEDISDVHDNYLLLRSASGSQYFIINEGCVLINRKTFGTTLHFFLFNRLIKDGGPQTGTVYIKSFRTFSNKQYVNVKVSRGEGWYYPGSKSRVVVGIYDVPFHGTVQAWDTVYSATGSPEEFNAKLSVPFHAYGEPDQAMASTDPAPFWKSEQPFDPVHDVMTYYLIHFGVNPTAAVSLIPFQVALQVQVQHIKLSLYSNIEVLSGDYEFLPN